MVATNFISSDSTKFPKVQWTIATTSGTLEFKGITIKGRARIFNPELVPEKIIFNPPATICIFPDGEKVVVQCTEGDSFNKQTGVAMCIMKKLFGNRADFKRLVETGYVQPEEESKK